MGHSRSPRSTCSLSGFALLVHNLPKQSLGQHPAIGRLIQQRHLLLVVAVLRRCCVMPGFLGAVMNSGGFVEGIRDHKALGADVPVPKSVRPPVIVVAGSVWVLGWQRWCRCW